MSNNSNKIATNIISGMKQALAYAQNDSSAVRVAKVHKIAVPIVDVHDARVSLGLTQKLFATTFGVSINTVRNWEQGR